MKLLWGVASVGALPLGFSELVRGKYLPAGLHAAEASYVSSSSISALRAAIVRAVWSSKMPLANAPALLTCLMVLWGLILHFILFGLGSHDAQVSCLLP